MGNVTITLAFSEYENLKKTEKLYTDIIATLSKDPKVLFLYYETKLEHWDNSIHEYVPAKTPRIEGNPKLINEILEKEYNDYIEQTNQIVLVIKQEYKKEQQRFKEEIKKLETQLSLPWYKRIFKKNE